MENAFYVVISRKLQFKSSLLSGGRRSECRPKGGFTKKNCLAMDFTTW